MNEFGEITIEHVGTRERKVMAVHQVYPREISVLWPLYGSMRFFCQNGKGIAKAKMWRIERESLKELRKKMLERGIKLGPLLEDESGQQVIKATR